jgi:hypothetical protein
VSNSTPTSSPLSFLQLTKTSLVATSLWRSVRTTLTLPKWGLGSPLGLPKTQSLIIGVKTPCLEVFFILLEMSWSVDVKMASHEPFGHLQHKLCTNERLGVKSVVWLPTIKSWESTRPRCVQVECNTPLESSQGKLQVCFRLHPNRRSKQRVMSCQSPESPNWDSFRTLPWESREKVPFECRCGGVTQRILYGGRWWLPSSMGHGESCESKVARGLS